MINSSKVKGILFMYLADANIVKQNNNNKKITEFQGDTDKSTIAVKILIPSQQLIEQVRRNQVRIFV